MRKCFMPFKKGRRKTGGRKKGTPNKFKRRDALETFLSLAQDDIDLVALAKRFLSGKNPSERVYLRILEYCEIPKTLTAPPQFLFFATKINLLLIRRLAAWT